MKKFCESLREHALNTIISENKKMKLLIKEQQGPYENAEICYVCLEKFTNKYLKKKIYRKVRVHCQYTWKYRGTAHSIFSLKYSVPEKILIAFHNESNYNFHLSLKSQQLLVQKTIYLFKRKH